MAISFSLGGSFLFWVGYIFLSTHAKHSLPHLPPPKKKKKKKKPYVKGAILLVSLPSDLFVYLIIFFCVNFDIEFSSWQSGLNSFVPNKIFLPPR